MFLAAIDLLVIPLKITVLGVADVTSKTPAVLVNKLAIPNIASDDKVSEVPLIVTLYRFAIPSNKLVPVNVIVPALAVNVPVFTSRLLVIVNVEAVVAEPVTIRENRLSVPELLSTFDVPVRVMLPADPVKLAPLLTVKFPATSTSASELKDPVNTTSFNLMLSPEMFLAEPVKVIVPPF